MGYSYGRTASGRSALSCDGCGSLDGTRKRVCPYTVLSSTGHASRRYATPYSPAPALCPACFKAEGGIRGVHGQECKDGAAAAQVEADAEQALIDSGAYLRRAAWGSWAAGVPAGQVGVLFRSTAGEVAFLMSKETYDAIPLLTPATPDDYRAFGDLVPIEPTHITDPKEATAA